ncbi:MAG: glycosyltransferase family 2 protein [Bacteroidales bacterium]|nr:glycosyltransferase family 2 protein [Bacteroidales bacterium]
MQLSVIIVNYNVEYFLEQCLYSVRKSISGIDAEVIVVDNNSIDGSNEMVRQKFPEVKLIENKDNRGFSKANNQGITISKGRYVLLLNPDTVVEDDTFSKIIAFMDNHPEAGALGVKMVDGAGNFLPESKRGLPTPLTSFYKMFGLSSLFPRSSRFARYHLGHLDKDKTHEVEILAGAFMLLRRSVLDKIGLLDETFFMYGEDIDLSYRVIKAGYKNFYFPETRIIHYKGESTKKGSVNYVLVFYHAMVIFANKHFSQKNARLYTLLINLAIYFRAFLSLMSRLIDRIFLPLLDAVLLYGGLFFIKEVWGREIIYSTGGDYPDTFQFFVLPVYILLWVLSVFFIGGYDRPVKMGKSILGMLMGTVVILVFYALLPEWLRFSRALILFGTLWGVVVLPLIRMILALFRVSWIQIGDNEVRRFLVIGDKPEARRVSDLLYASYIRPSFVGWVSPDEKPSGDKDFVGNISQVVDIIRIYKISEVVFCSKSIPHQVIINKMTEWKSTQTAYKIAPEDSLSIIGSNSIHTQGDLYTVDIHAVDSTANRRNKRLLDMVLGMLFLVASPLLMWVMKSPFGFISNVIQVLFGFRSWVGYHPVERVFYKLPVIRKGVLTPISAMKHQQFSDETITNLNLLYARDYRAWKDVNIIFYAFRDLGN